MSDNKTLITLWTNNEKRQAFLSNYKDWGVWITTPELSLTYYRYILPNETVIIALEYKRSPSRYSTGTTGVFYYVQRKGEYISPGYTNSISAVAEHLKEAKCKLQEEAKKIKTTTGEQ